MKAKLFLKSTFDNGDCIEYAADASVEKTNDSFVISYNEDQQNYAQTTGVIGISDGVMTLNRVGQFPATFLFVKGQKHGGRLATLVGEIDIVINTYSLDISFNDRGVSAAVRYEMSFQGAATVCAIDLTCEFLGGAL